MQNIHFTITFESLNLNDYIYIYAIIPFEKCPLCISVLHNTKIL